MSGVKNARCALRGVLELRRAPDYPWDGRQALQLAVAGFVSAAGKWNAGRCFRAGSDLVVEPVEHGGKASRER